MEPEISIVSIEVLRAEFSRLEEHLLRKFRNVMNERHAPIRAQHTAYYEKLAILDGGTLALVVTVGLGNLKGQIPHARLIAAGMLALALAMLMLLLRNFLAMQYEEQVVLNSESEKSVLGGPLFTTIYGLSFAGAFGSFLGIVLLAAAVAATFDPSLAIR